MKNSEIRIHLRKIALYTISSDTRTELNYDDSLVIVNAIMKTYNEYPSILEHVLFQWFNNLITIHGLEDVFKQFELDITKY